MWDWAGLRLGVRGAEAGTVGRGTMRASGEKDAGMISKTSGGQRRRKENSKNNKRPG